MPVVRMIKEILPMEVSELTIVVSGLKQTRKYINAGGGNNEDTKLAKYLTGLSFTFGKSLSKMAFPCPTFMTNAADAFFDQKQPQLVIQFMVLARKT